MTSSSSASRSRSRPSRTTPAPEAAVTRPKSWSFWPSQRSRRGILDSGRALSEDLSAWLLRELAGEALRAERLVMQPLERVGRGPSPPLLPTGTPESYQGVTRRRRSRHCAVGPILFFLTAVGAAATSRLPGFTRAPGGATSGASPSQRDGGRRGRGNSPRHPRYHPERDRGTAANVACVSGSSPVRSPRERPPGASEDPPAAPG